MDKNLLKKYLVVLVAINCISNTITVAQKRNESQSLKISWDDDFWNLRGEGTDRGYTSGLIIEYYYTKKIKAKFPSTLLMKISEKADNIYAWGLTQKMYAPNDISANAIQYGDRPYAGATYFSHLLISSDDEKKQKLTTSISLGALGKYSFAKEIQTWGHDLINYQKPNGWDNQIKSDIIINYYINYEHLLFHPAPTLELLGNIETNVGTLSNNMGLGIHFRAGLFYDYFSNFERVAFRRAKSTSMRKFQFFFYMKTNGTVVMDDASLQGGAYSGKTSPYVISKDSLSRFYMQYEYGIVLANKRFGLAFAEKIRTPEFKNSYSQQIGNFTFYIGL